MVVRTARSLVALTAMTVVTTSCGFVIPIGPGGAPSASFRLLPRKGTDAAAPPAPAKAVWHHQHTHSRQVVLRATAGGGGGGLNNKDRNWLVEKVLALLNKLLVLLRVKRGGSSSAAKPWDGLFRAPAKEEVKTVGKRVKALLRKRSTYLALAVLLLAIRGAIGGPARRMVPRAELPLSEFLRLTAVSAFCVAVDTRVFASTSFASTMSCVPYTDTHLKLEAESVADAHSTRQLTLVEQQQCLYARTAAER
jgi:hypothetical protein